MVNPAPSFDSYIVNNSFDVKTISPACRRSLEVRIRAALASSDVAVERAMAFLFLRQTSEEKAVSTTNVTNARGFAQPHARKGSYYGRWVLSGRKLSGLHLDKARKISQSYAGTQLLELACFKLVNEQEDQRDRKKSNFSLFSKRGEPNKIGSPRFAVYSVS